MDDLVAKKLLELFERVDDQLNSAKEHASVTHTQGVLLEDQGRLLQGISLAIRAILQELEATHPGIGERAITAFKEGCALYDAETGKPVVVMN